MAELDTDINNYTIDELFSILELDKHATKEQILWKTNDLIDRFGKDNNEKLVLFFFEIQKELLEYNQKKVKEKTDDWYKYESLPQKNKIQKDKITDRAQKINVYDNEHMPMKREQLGINNVFDTKVAQDVLNPNLENITSRFINLDSQFRQAAGGIDTLSTDYTLDLSDPLTNVLSLRLYSIQIPYTWYTIDTQYGNTCFWITNYNKSFIISVTPGNYNPSDFVIELNAAFKRAGFTNIMDENSLPVSYNANNGKISIALGDVLDPDGVALNTILETDIFLINSDYAYFTFFDFTGEKNCAQTCGSQSFAFNHTLGWLMGFRLPITPIYFNGNTPLAVLDLFGPKYFIVVLDDYNQNHINNGLITITELSNSLPLPSYYNPTAPVNCILPVTNINEQITDLYNYANTNSYTATDNTGNLIEDKLKLSYLKTPQVLPTAPRTLTQAQLYTVNQIIKNREKNTSYRGKAPTPSDTFALIPMKHTGMKTGEMYIDYGGALQDNKRIYFGPVDIDRMHLKLIDDRGFKVDLHGVDWCITLISENLYQY